MTPESLIVPPSLTVPAEGSRPALELRAWREEDLESLVEHVNSDFADPPAAAPVSAWLRFAPRDFTEAQAWLVLQEEGWQRRNWLSFAVVGDGDVLGNVAVKAEPEGAPLSECPSAEVSYWTATSARGRGVATAALEEVSRWVLDSFRASGLKQLRAVHDETNIASCHVARKCGFALAEISPANPPHWLTAAHIHVRSDEEVSGES